MLDQFLARLAMIPADDTPRGDHDLTPGWAPEPPFKPAAVLIPVIARTEPAVLFTTRAPTLPVHPGQISFPGGRVEPDDKDAEATALRETEEELGVAPALVQTVGRLSHYVTRTGFIVTPIIGTLTPPLRLRPDPIEVANVFEVPLAYLLSDRAPRREGRVFNGVRREFWQFDWQGHVIWGATAGMLMSLRRRLGINDPVLL